MIALSVNSLSAIAKRRARSPSAYSYRMARDNMSYMRTV